MKKDVLLLLVCVMLCAGCEQTKEERMIDLLTEGITTGANDPSSVQDVKVTIIKKKEEVDAHGKRSWHYYVALKYREKNEYGALVNRDRFVKLNEECDTVESWDALGSNW